jgi:hypothetical protein
MDEKETRQTRIGKRQNLDTLCDSLHRKILSGQVTRTELKEALKAASMVVTECVGFQEHRISTETLNATNKALSSAATLIDEVILAFAVKLQ